MPDVLGGCSYVVLVYIEKTERKKSNLFASKKEENIKYLGKDE